MILRSHLSDFSRLVRLIRTSQGKTQSRGHKIGLGKTHSPRDWHFETNYTATPQILIDTRAGPQTSTNKNIRKQMDSVGDPIY